MRFCRKSPNVFINTLHIFASFCQAYFKHLMEGIISWRTPTQFASSYENDSHGYAKTSGPWNCSWKPSMKFSWNMIINRLEKGRSLLKSQLQAKNHESLISKVIGKPMTRYSVNILKCITKSYWNTILSSIFYIICSRWILHILHDAGEHNLQGLMWQEMLNKQGAGLLHFEILKFKTNRKSLYSLVNESAIQALFINLMHCIPT